MTIKSNISTITVNPVSECTTAEPAISSTCCLKNCSLYIDKFRVSNNLWGFTGTSGPMVCQDGSSVCKLIKYADNTVGWEWNNPTGTGGGWKYPLVRLKDSSWYKIGNLTKLDTLFRKYYYINSTYVNLAYDVYFYPSADKPYFSGININFMVWFDHNVTNNPPGAYVTDVNDGYNTYKVYRRVGRYSGEDPPIGWYVFIRQGPKQEIYNCDLKRLIDFMKTMPSIITRSSDGKTAKGNITNNDYINLATLMLGTEFVTGAGRIRIAKWNIKANSDTYNVGCID